MAKPLHRLAIGAFCRSFINSFPAGRAFLTAVTDKREQNSNRTQNHTQNRCTKNHVSVS
jgi:hypothetical protein